MKLKLTVTTFNDEPVPSRQEIIDEMDYLNLDDFNQIEIEYTVCKTVAKPESSFFVREG